jgi:nitrate reductase gamma subunit
MSKARLSVVVFGLYLIIVVGLGFMLVPQIPLDLFGLGAADDFWVRFAGMLSSIIGAYYLLAAREEMESFYLWTVPARYFAAAFMLLMVVLGKIGSVLLLFAAIDAASATWTWIASRST